MKNKFFSYVFPDHIPLLTHTVELSWDFKKKIRPQLDNHNVGYCAVNGYSWEPPISDIGIMDALGNPYNSIVDRGYGIAVLAKIVHSIAIIDHLDDSQLIHGIFFMRGSSGDIFSIIIEYYRSSNTILLDATEFGGKYSYAHRLISLHPR